MRLDGMCMLETHLPKQVLWYLKPNSDMNLNNINCIIYCPCKEYSYNKTLLAMPRKYILDYD